MYNLSISNGQCRSGQWGSEFSYATAPKSPQISRKRCAYLSYFLLMRESVKQYKKSSNLFCHKKVEVVSAKKAGFVPGALSSSPSPSGLSCLSFLPVV